MTVEELIDFEDEIKALYNAGTIPFPVHFSSGNEEQLIEVFQEVGPDDWCLGSWRAHYMSLLRGVPREEVKVAILAGRSITLTFPKYRVLTSAIVAGMAPIAVGIAKAIKLNGGHEKVWLFLGDMAASTGCALEAATYAYNFDLPLQIVVEDNGLSVCSNTKETWGADYHKLLPGVQRYEYVMKVPHAGAGKRINF